MDTDSLETLVETIALERLKLDPHIKLNATVALASLRAFQKICNESSISMEQLTPELLISKMTKNNVTATDIEEIRKKVKEAASSEDSYTQLRLLTTCSRPTR